MASAQADKKEDRAVEAAEYAAEQISEARRTPPEETMDQIQESESSSGALRSMLGTVTGKAAELKEFVTEKKEEIKMKIPMDGNCPREVLEETETEGRKKMGDIRVEEIGAGEENPEFEAAVREFAAKEAAAHRGMAGKSNIMGMMGSVKESIRSKLTMPSQIVSDTLAAQRHGGTGRATDGEKVDVASDNTPVGVVDSMKLKANRMAEQVKEAATSKKLTKP